MGLQPAFHPVIPEDGLAAGGLPELRPDRHRGRHPVRDFLAFPLRHRGHDREEKPAGRGRGVDRFLERNQVGVVLAELLGELQKLPGIAGEPGQLGEHQSADVPPLHVRHHAFRLGVILHGFAAHRVQSIDLDDGPVLGDRERPGPLLVMAGTLALDLFIRRNADPNADSPFERSIHDSL